MSFRLSKSAGFTAIPVPFLTSNIIYLYISVQFQKSFLLSSLEFHCPKPICNWVLFLIIAASTSLRKSNFCMYVDREMIRVWFALLFIDLFIFWNWQKKGFGRWGSLCGSATETKFWQPDIVKLRRYVHWGILRLEENCT